MLAFESNCNVWISMFAFAFECNQQFYVFLFQTKDEETACDLISHEGLKVHNYLIKFKITAIKYAEVHSNRAARRKFGDDWKRIRELRVNKEEILSTTEKVERG